MGHKKKSAAPKAKMGRPPVDDADRKSKVVKARVTEVEYADMKKAAQPGTVSDWARSTLLDAARKG